MAGTTISEESIDGLLSSFDRIYDAFKDGISEMQSLSSSYDAETKKREALQYIAHSLQSENERLTKLYAESLNKLADQVENRVRCRSLKEELKRVSDEHNKRETEYRDAIESMNQNTAMRIQGLESQIREFQVQKLANEGTINKLQNDLTAHKSLIESLSRKLEKVYADVESKYHYEIQGLKDCLLVEQEEKNELNKKFQDLEKEYLVVLISKTKLAEHQQDITSSRHMETLKQKIMKLRKENEVLRRQLVDSKEG